MENICVEAGTEINFEVTASSPNNSALTLSATGGPFLFQPPILAIFLTSSAASPITKPFNWLTDWAHVIFLGVVLADHGLGRLVPLGHCLEFIESHVTLPFQI
jgi:hypothetical protein